MVITSSHDFSNFNRIISKPIILENNVWVGSNVTIIGGVTVDENSVIGSGSVVSRDIPPNVLAVGNPCETLKTICRKL
jgi:acetyltransferase-like isoleucine patch superfamily enzyme